MNWWVDCMDVPRENIVTWAQETPKRLNSNSSTKPRRSGILEVHQADWLNCEPPDYDCGWSRSDCVGLEADQGEFWSQQVDLEEISENSGGRWAWRQIRGNRHRRGRQGAKIGEVNAICAAGKTYRLGAFSAPWLMVRNAEGKVEPFFGSDSLRFYFISQCLGLLRKNLRAVTASAGKIIESLCSASNLNYWNNSALSSPKVGPPHPPTRDVWAQDLLSLGQFASYSSVRCPFSSTHGTDYDGPLLPPPPIARLATMFSAGRYWRFPVNSAVIVCSAAPPLSLNIQPTQSDHADADNQSASDPASHAHCLHQYRRFLSVRHRAGFSIVLWLFGRGNDTSAREPRPAKDSTPAELELESTEPTHYRLPTLLRRASLTFSTEYTERERRLQRWRKRRPRSSGPRRIRRLK
ncbi:hypothetical protein B0H16DRAFT_1824042 [Mycena metata]|uniref:Uncharacterized protein n=1 Tax=Mycena metata TaxID=1033252 RepID=A0AAD7J907_9AGAR|nr:hypothetical protein B0H16DRAFT_1824042 [Mycena metata]